MLRQAVRRADGAAHQLAAAVRTAIVERVRAVGAESALERTDKRARRIGGQIDATYIWEPTLSQLGGTALTTSAQVAEQGAPTYDLEGARGDLKGLKVGVVKQFDRDGWQDDVIANFRNSQPVTFTFKLNTKLNGNHAIAPGETGSADLTIGGLPHGIDATTDITMKFGSDLLCSKPDTVELHGVHIVTPRKN